MVQVLRVFFLFVIRILCSIFTIVVDMQQFINTKIYPQIQHWAQ